MAIYEVVVVGESYEVYHFEAESEEEACDEIFDWGDKPISSEVTNQKIESVRELYS